MTMSPSSFQVELEGEATSARAYAPEGTPLGATWVFAHGAGAGQTSPFIVRFASALAERGVQVITFNFPYMERGKRVPDRANALESCYRAVIREAVARSPGAALFVGGKSLGGRIATHVAASADDVAEQVSGIICLGYPLHPPGQPSRLRSEHLPRIRAPVLIAQGERDAFGSPEEIRTAIGAMEAPVKLFVVEGGDHSLSVGKSAPTRQVESDRRVQDAIAAWIKQAIGSREREAAPNAPGRGPA
jgi:predicted alpha/beta-hydrolase family hydrolase